MLLALLGACASVPVPRDQDGTAGRPAGEPRWWVVRVRMGDDPAQTVDWHLDALLADQVFAPIVRRLEPALVLWRFHRRAAPDATGHQFRFLFYADAAIASRVAAALRASSVLDALVRSGRVRAVLIPGPDESSGAAVEAQSDPAWPVTVQRAWPHFAMGVSRNWLAMIQEERGNRPSSGRGGIDELVARYRDINASVDTLWRGHGQHAWLHHLNALFGYQPVLIREQRLTQF